MAVVEFPTERSAQVRDIFLFCCYTGLAYADIKKLKRSEVVIGVYGEKWIFTSRQKTETPSKIPLFPSALQILKKYEDHSRCINQNLLMPVLSNQKMNDYLKQIADLSEATDLALISNQNKKDFIDLTVWVDSYECLK